MNDHVVIRGNNLSLGAMKRDYVQQFMGGANDPEVMRGVVLQPPVTLEAELAWYDETVAKRHDVIFAILLHLKRRGRMAYRYIGHTGLHGIMWPSGCAESGTIIWDKTCHGQGYGKEAKMLLLRHAFHDLGLRKVRSRVKAFNGNSWGHLLACGFTEIGRSREQHFSEGRYVDEIILEVFRPDWESCWERYCKTGKLPRLTEAQRSHVKKEAGLS